MSLDDVELRFERWLREHMRVIWKIVRAFAVTPHDHDDLLQEVLIQLWSSLPRYRQESKETTWIYQVSFNTALVWRRGETRRRRRVLPLAIEPAQPSTGHKIEVLEQLYEAIRQLSAVDASLVVMHLDGLSYQEMAMVLGIKDNAVGVRLHRLRKQLAEQLKGIRDEL